MKSRIVACCLLWAGWVMLLLHSLHVAAGFIPALLFPEGPHVALGFSPAFLKQGSAHLKVAAAKPDGMPAGPTASAPDKVRAFTLKYQFTVNGIPSGARRVRIWIPRPSSDTEQSVALKSALGPVRLRETREARFGDRILYAEILHPKSPRAEFTLVYDVTRREYSKGDFESLMKFNRDPDPPPMCRQVAFYLLPDRLVPTSGKIRELADGNTQGKQRPVEKAYALYNYVFHSLRYDKSGTGWGRGDALWVCDSKHGNCTDFHSLFISLARAERIPARFEIGFPIPKNSHGGQVPGYHCWAEFYVDGPGWVPVDISEAWKDPAQHDYFFGTLDANRVQFSMGRDLELAPRQDGPPVNYFVYPYVEVDGKPFDKVEKRFSFTEHMETRMTKLADSSDCASR